MSPDHVCMLISAPPHLSLSKIVQYIKGKTAGNYNARSKD
ncbi:MAG: transposase [Alphaproteobacteria bacterium]|nr:transposase [Alphaproteobacteria bacterium]